MHNLEIEDVVAPYLKELSHVTGETSFFVVYNNGETVYLYKTEGTQSIRISAQLGMRRPVHCTAVGKAIISTFSMEEVDRIIQDKGMSKFTDNTIVDRHELHEELSRVRLEDCAVDCEEIEIGLTCFAVPVFNYTGRVAGSISLSGPTWRMKSNQDKFIEKLKEAAKQISRRLGFVPMMRSSL